jgi:phosphomannomutase
MSDLPTPENPRIAALFDVDGTLTIPRGEVTRDTMETLKELRKKITVGIVGGSDLPKQEEQLGKGIVNEVVWNFSQNGLVAYHKGILLESNSIAKHLGEDTIKRIVNWVLKYLAGLDLPVKVSRYHAISKIVQCCRGGFSARTCPTSLRPLTMYS